VHGTVDERTEAVAVDEVPATEPFEPTDAIDSASTVDEAVVAASDESLAHEPGLDAPVMADSAPPDQHRYAESSPNAAPVNDYVDLGSLLADDEEEEASTRFRIRETPPTGDEDQDFAELLRRFKEKVAEHVPAEDAAAHYDLGLAFKEMGLIDEAISEFQVALRSGHMQLKVYEELGHCFLHNEQFKIAEKVLLQALQVERDNELELLGIYYQLGRAYEALGRLDQARDAYERVLGMDLRFHDTAERLARL
jgi:tetratricopeptide (TPR) repeat protein